MVLAQVDSQWFIIDDIYNWLRCKFWNCEFYESKSQPKKVEEPKQEPTKEPESEKPKEPEPVAEKKEEKPAPAQNSTAPARKPTSV